MSTETLAGSQQPQASVVLFVHCRAHGPCRLRMVLLCLCCVVLKDTSCAQTAATAPLSGTPLPTSSETQNQLPVVWSSSAWKQSEKTEEVLLFKEKGETDRGLNVSSENTAGGAVRTIFGQLLLLKSAVVPSRIF